jgi:hypothetical protein
MSTPTTTQDNAPVLTEAQRQTPQLRWVDGFGRLLDTQYRIPGTRVRFGLDFLLGLIPGAGDILSLGMSGVLILTMARHGASGRLVAKMLGNVALDTLVGAVPVLGDLFDLAFKSNYRNLKLLREHYESGAHTGSARPVLIGALVGVVGLFVAVVIGIFFVLSWVFGLLNQALGL